MRRDLVGLNGNTGLEQGSGGGGGREKGGDLRNE